MCRASWYLVLLLVALPGCEQQEGEAGGPPKVASRALPAAREGARAAPRIYENLGTHHYRINTAVPQAQRFFDQGLRLTYGFNHAEAIRSFREAGRLDPECAMCAWGEALAFGPNINATMDSVSGVAAYAAVRRAQSLSRGASLKEQAYIRALAVRYGPNPTADRASHDSAYAHAMGELARQHPQDDDAAVLHAEAQMLLSPWDYWLPGLHPRSNGREALRSLETVLARNPDHVGACHFFIHAVEAAYPERAVPCAERLPALMPGAGHIVHMPAHIYIRVGRYADAIERNLHAVHADEAVLGDFAPNGVYRLAYYPHNYHFLWFAASMAGHSRLAIRTARQVADRVDLNLLRQPGLGALQHYLVTPLFALVRFGRWDEILREPAPPVDLPYPIGIWHYARALAFTAKGRLTEAESELALLRQKRRDPRVEKVTIWDLNRAATLLEIAAEVVAAEIAIAQERYAAAVGHFRRAVELEDAMVYDEPPTWHLPVRQQLGTVLLTASRPAEAETVYRQDLERHPENGWALFGLAQTLRTQGRRGEAAQIEARFHRAWAQADVTLTRSRF